jgi:hypothetical protein
VSIVTVAPFEIAAELPAEMMFAATEPAMPTLVPLAPDVACVTN